MTAVTETTPLNNKILNATVIVTALGYMVDVYDMLLFNVVRATSLADIGLSGDALTQAGLYIINMQMTGLLLGGLLWGVLGDKVGRKQCLIGSILLYSLATLGCAFVQTADQYAVLRFLAGLGLAGEVGVGITLIAETMTKEKRGLGCAVFAFVGIFGAVIAAILAEVIDWRTCYLIGGIAGLLLLVTRTLVMESGMYHASKNAPVSRGNILMILGNGQLLKRYVFCILVGMPMYFVIGIVWTLAPEISLAMGSSTPAKASLAIGIGYIGVMAGDIIAGLLSQYLQRRRRTIKIFVCTSAIVLTVFLLQRSMTPDLYYAFAVVLGIATGYWVTVLTMAAEQFGTNIRATAATSVPNFIRATLLPMNFLFAALKPEGVLYAVAVVGAVAIALSLFSLTQLKETFKKDLDYND